MLYAISYSAAKADLCMVDEEPTIKVASKKDTKDKPNGVIKLKKPAPKHASPGNWKDGQFIDSNRLHYSSNHCPPTDPNVTEEKKKNNASPAITAPSPGPVVNQLDENSLETFATGRPMEDSPDLHQCKHCKKSILKTAAKAHIAQCLKVKKEKAQRKKEAREARERAKELAREEEARKNGEEVGDKVAAAAPAADDDSDGDDDIPPDKKGASNSAKTTKKSAAAKKLEAEADKKGKKRKADGDADKGPKTKKKKEEPKPKAPKPKGTCGSSCGGAIVQRRI
jgi:SAGA-associated factor 73